MTERTDLDLKALRAKLTTHRDEMRADEASTAADRATVDAGDTAMGRLSRMDALQQQAMAQETERRRQVELKRIDAALERMEAGEYGACLHCGADIETRRLEFDPAAPLCVSCASETRGKG
ncbi:TraR/DksA family transcriptional regulator [Roseospira marina]|uniref:TraR/DksA family transcriptional regulator n=1 Tax=Roseospira marina TaxID=140057 RepID=A0A5M6IGN3_9PROT|nr:TraR/DksA C4-type zinc finger protein [Roseospira marina]KAA5607433.1 TraR/DksA family transcriptional regulator [Roseospira marina]MBB4312390.1 DnaK suppressor protein [Roseospira marina]MBB5085594.1 DnaK suppressor protein [Roseospira marina]